MSVDTITFNANVGGYKAAENVNGRLRENIFDVTLSSGYPANGYTLFTSGVLRYGQMGMKTLIGVETVGQNTAALLYTVIYDTTLKTLRVITAGAEISTNTSLSTIVFRLKFIGAS